MTLNFPSNPPDGEKYLDNCGNIWVYDSTDNKWVIFPNTAALNPDQIWKRSKTTGRIIPVNAGDDLDMAGAAGNINVQSFPEVS